jgi:hypothetical protein
MAESVDYFVWAYIQSVYRHVEEVIGRKPREKVAHLADTSLHELAAG